jgi:hypothetical protein
MLNENAMLDRINIYGEYFWIVAVFITSPNAEMPRTVRSCTEFTFIQIISELLRVKSVL